MIVFNDFYCGRKWSMVVELAAGHALISHEMCKMVLPGVSVMNWL